MKDQKGVDDNGAKMFKKTSETKAFGKRVQTDNQSIVTVGNQIFAKLKHKCRYKYKYKYKCNDEDEILGENL